MSPDEVRTATADLAAAIARNDDDASAQIAMQLCCGAALNLALIAERLTPIVIGMDLGTGKDWSADASAST